MGGIGREVTAAIDGSAVGNVLGTIGALADTIAASDQHKAALADHATSPAMVQVGSQVNAGAAASGQSRPAS